MIEFNNERWREDSLCLKSNCKSRFVQAFINGLDRTAKSALPNLNLIKLYQSSIRGKSDRLSSSFIIRIKGRDWQ